MVEDYHICIARRPAPCQGLHPQVHKTLQVSPEGYTISGRHSAHVANSAPSTFKLSCNGRIHFAQNFKTWSTISCAIFGKHTNTDIFFDWYFFKITIIFNSCKVINPASNPQPSFLQIINGRGAASCFYYSWRDPLFSIFSLHGKMFHTKFIIVDYLLKCSGWSFGIFMEPAGVLLHSYTTVKQSYDYTH